MDNYLIKGGNVISGKVKISASKNAVLPMICASILTQDTVFIQNCPKIQDVYSLVEILNYLGATTNFADDGLYINCKDVNKYTVPKELSYKLRASSILLGALSAKVGKAVLSYPGGCKIGERPLDIHIDVLKSFGAKITELEGVIISEASNKHDAQVSLKYPSVGATENAILMAVLSKGVSVIRNCAREPEIRDLCNFLNNMGAKIALDNDGIIRIEGVERLNGVSYKPIADRIEAGTFLLASAITGGEIEILGVNVENIFSIITKLCENTCKISIKNDIIYIKSTRNKKPFVIKTGPHPMFPTDLQAPISVLACLCNGVSVIEEQVFPNRFMHVPYLNLMGAKISVKNNLAFIVGVNSLKGAVVEATDLRGGASMVLAGLCAEGETLVKNIHHVERGYENFVEKIRSLGGEIFKR